MERGREIWRLSVRPALPAQRGILKYAAPRKKTQSSGAANFRTVDVDRFKYPVILPCSGIFCFGQTSNSVLPLRWHPVTCSPLIRLQGLPLQRHGPSWCYWGSRPEQWYVTIGASAYRQEMTKAHLKQILQVLNYLPFFFFFFLR